MLLFFSPQRSSMNARPHLSQVDVIVYGVYARRAEVHQVFSPCGVQQHNIVNIYIQIFKIIAYVSSMLHDKKKSYK